MEYWLYHLSLGATVSFLSSVDYAYPVDGYEH